jgi:hypothetical protein
MAIDEPTRRLVRTRADDRCEYCLFPQAYAETRHHVEHIVARQHGGGDEDVNLALACQHCNAHKGPNLTGIDPDTGAVVSLFHPRREAWADHFLLRGALILGRTAMGRATVAVLAMNARPRLDVRRALIEEGLYP